MRRKRYKRRNYRRAIHRKKTLFIFMVGIALVLDLSLLFSVLTGRSQKEDSKKGEKTYDNIHVVDIDMERLRSRNSILASLDSGEILAGYRIDYKIYPASLTKIMTAIIAIENTENLEETMILSDPIFTKLYKEEASLAGFQSGEEVYLKDLLYGIILPSGAECCIAFAERISGSEKEFVDLMNQKAKELGMQNTHFCNSTGLHDSEHYSTVEDISILLQYALENENFKKVFRSSQYSVSPTNRHPDGFTFHSTMFQCMDENNLVVTNGNILGGKTGYTEEAGLCLASWAEIGEKEYILVTAKANGNHETEPYHILDAIDVYNQID